MTGFGWGVVGPGRIAHKFAEAVQDTEGMHLAAVCGRDPHGETLRWMDRIRAMVGVRYPFEAALETA